MVIFYFLFFVSVIWFFPFDTTKVRRLSWVSNSCPTNDVKLSTNRQTTRICPSFYTYYIYKNENRGRNEGGLNSNDYLYQDLNNRVT